ncbi:YbaK/EbsC family protein [Aliikangiella sp. G2MR2-5]|uniref:YbaK/EbsC family protein n=1 Tax=Aliikangiella sp. G2MR2-5 TaxID=2788943 RepID=UPI0018A8FAFB|nr:YbaK/EbsC family protein [Aliikangiella sp. G2MR2-5]
MRQKLKALKYSSQRVQDFLKARGKALNVCQLPSSTRTAKEAAETIGCSVAQIAKSLIFRDKHSEQHVLVVASGTNRVCNKKIEAATGIHLDKADAEYVRDRTGFAIGGVPPVAHTSEPVTILDPDLKKFDTIWAAAGTPNSVFQLTVDDLDELTNGRWIDLAE